jgi:hypothetical protein
MEVLFDSGRKLQNQKDGSVLFNIAAVVGV